MKVSIPQSIGIRIGNTISAVKRAAKSGLNYVSNAFERSPASDVFVRSTRFSKRGTDEAEKKYIERINQVPVGGVGNKELPILRLVQESM